MNGLIVLQSLAAGGLTLLLMPLLSPLARKAGLLDHPGGRKDHAAATPVTGGLVITLVAGAAIFFEGALDASTFGLLLAAGLLLVVGVLDDIFDLDWKIRISSQVVAAIVLIAVGGVRIENLGPVFGFGEADLGSLSVPFTILATVGLINALNMCDGVDGLCGSMALCALVMLIAAAEYAGNHHLTQPLLTFALCVAGFLFWNMRTPWRSRARVFLGNSGSAVLGLVIAWAAFRLTQSTSHPVRPVLAPFLIAPPVIDCLALMLKRATLGRSPFAADRNHMHHILLDGGLSVTWTVTLLCSISLTIGLVAAIAMRAHVPHPLFLLSYLAMLVAYVWATRSRKRSVAAVSKLADALRLRSAPVSDAGDLAGAMESRKEAA